MSNSLSSPFSPVDSLRRVAILFAGGPAPAANAVISTAAAAFLRSDIEVVGIRYGYAGLIEFGPERPLEPGHDYTMVDHAMLSRTRNAQGILLGTSRANPGKLVNCVADLDDPDKVAPLARVYAALESLGVDGLVSIGGDDTLKTANKLKLYQDRLPDDAHRIRIVHLPKTIDNDYSGIDFTFGYFTAVDMIAGEIRNLLHDAEATRAYFVAETMGRSAGWLAYGTAIAGEASLVISVEDINDEYHTTETIRNPVTGELETREVMVLEAVVDRAVKTMRAREAEGKLFGVIVIAEGLAEMLPARFLEGIPRDDHGHITIAHVKLGAMFAKLVAAAYTAATGTKRKLRGLQLGYESRCERPHAFDVMLGSQLGVGAFRALAQNHLDGVMVSVRGQLDLHYVPFDQLVDPETLVTKVRHIRAGSDFHRLARFLETNVND